MLVWFEHNLLLNNYNEIGHKFYNLCSPLPLHEILIPYIAFLYRSAPVPVVVLLLTSFLNWNAYK